MLGAMSRIGLGLVPAVLATMALADAGAPETTLEISAGGAIPPAQDLVAPAPQTQAPLIRGRVTISGAPAAGVTVGYNMVKSPRVQTPVLPSTRTDAEGWYQLPRLPADARSAALWIEARDPHETMCPAQLFPAGAASFDFASCDPPKPSPETHRLSGRVTVNGHGVPRIGIHQAFATRRGAEYAHTEFGSVVAYTDDEGRWSFSAPSVSARTQSMGYLSYLTAIDANGLEFCPPQIPLDENLRDADKLDFSACDPVEEDLPPEGTSQILAAPAEGSWRDPALAMLGDAPAITWLRDGAEGVVEILFSRWDRKEKHWTAAASVASAHAPDGIVRYSFAANAKTLALAYEDRREDSATHVVLMLSSDDGRTWQAQQLGNFSDNGAAPALALGSRGDVHLAYWHSDAENPGRVVYQRRRPGGEFRAVALPLSNLLGETSQMSALPSLDLAVDENDIAAIAYFMGADDQLQLAFWKPGMPVAVKITEMQAPAAAKPELKLALFGGHANVFYRLGGDDMRLQALEGDYGEQWNAPVVLKPGGGARGDGALSLVINHEGDRVFATGSAGGGSWWLVHGADLKRLLMVDEKNASLGRNTAGLGLALDGERRVNAVTINGADGALTLYRKLLP